MARRFGPAFGGALSGRDLVPISEVERNPLRIEDRVKKVADGAGGLIEQTVKFPVWFDPVANNGTPMAEAMAQAKGILQHVVGRSSRLLSAYRRQHHRRGAQPRQRPGRRGAPDHGVVQ